MSKELSDDFCTSIMKKLKVPRQRPIFVIHEHHARRLHWDLRLEFDEALWSWALPKGPPRESEKRLAIQVEDHPLAYAGFEGTIPEGNYGAGKVAIWDRGTFLQMERTQAKIVVELKGQRLKGRFCLLYFKSPNNWLFFRIKPKDVVGKTKNDTKRKVD